MSAQRKDKPGLVAFRYSNFRWYWIGQLSTNIGTWMQMVATGWLVLQLTNSPVALGLNSAFQAVPMIFFTFFGGVIGDRVDRFKLLVLNQAVRIVPDVLLAYLVASGKCTVADVYIYSLFSAVVNGLTTPGRQAMVPRLVPATAMLSAIALSSTVWQGAAVVGPSLAGIILAAWGLPMCFWINAGSDFFNLFTLFFLRLAPEAEGRRAASAWNSLVEGLHYLGHPGPVRTILLTVTCVNVFGRAYQQLLPVFAQDVFRTGPTGLGLMTSMPAVGAVGASVILATLAGRNLIRWFMAGTALVGVALVGFALTPNFLVALGLLILVGGATSAVSTLSSTMLQQMVEDRMLGRIYSFQIAGAQGGSKLGVLPAGILAQVATPGLAILASALILLAVLMPALRSSSLRLVPPRREPEPVPIPVLSS
ncbi:MAG TPA: MFS transporter [Chloroflexota bacterium]|nr:MFS transporter [Chloroflexota bacterium]